MNSIIPILANIRNLKSGNDTLNFMLHYPKTYVMDNHLGAGWCWLQELDPQQSYGFFHIDRHEDLCGARRLEYFRHLRDNPKVPIEEYTGFSFQEETRQSKVFVWDNYIKTIQTLFPAWFSECYFACPSSVSDPPHYTKMPLNIVYNASPLELYSNINYWIKEAKEPFIVNLDIDYFFDDERMLLYSDDYISTFAKHLNAAMDNVAVLTIALSPECCGGWEAAFQVYDIIANELDAIDG